MIRYKIWWKCQIFKIVVVITTRDPCHKREFSIVDKEVVVDLFKSPTNSIALVIKMIDLRLSYILITNSQIMCKYTMICDQRNWLKSIYFSNFGPQTSTLFDIMMYFEFKGVYLTFFYILKQFDGSKLNDLT